MPTVLWHYRDAEGKTDLDSDGRADLPCASGSLEPVELPVWRAVDGSAPGRIESGELVMAMVAELGRWSRPLTEKQRLALRSSYS
jgi:hypothetical protein